MRPISSVQRIAGRHHPLVKRIRGMVRSGDLLDLSNTGNEVLLETPNLIEDAIQNGVTINVVLLRGDAPPSVRALRHRIPPGAKQYDVEPKLFPELTSTENNPGIVALAKAPIWKEQDLFAGRPPLVVVLAGIQDPGNLGTILRAAEAFGVTGVLTTKGTVSPYNAKAIRAASGTLFHLPVITNLPAQRIISLLRRENVTLLVSAARGGKSLAEFDVSKPLALALGSEGSGLPRELGEAGLRVSIPMAPPVESLNVATAASVMLYEIARRRQPASASESAKERN
ncbi:MAG: RNA methyltransferase [Acidobacteria bacterium]|nr:RNA methyltransferase [Acidobacteriota bacterium]